MQVTMSNKRSRDQRRSRMKTSERIWWFVLAVAGLMTAHALAGTKPSEKNAGTAQWSVQVARVDPGDVELGSSFEIAIYENLLHEMGDMRQFNEVLRDGDDSASTNANLLILKTTVEEFSPGSETKRAVTTFGGATKLTVRSQLCTRDGKVLEERTVHGNVRFFGSNLRAAHTLAHNVTKAINDLPLPIPTSTSALSSQ